MGKIYCLIGKSGSGKSTIEKLLENKGIKRIISTTTRPIREKEVEGVDYHYVTEEEFKQLHEKNTLLEESNYNNWHYGIDTEYNQLNIKNNNYICVIEPTGYSQLLNSIGKDNLVCIYITVNNKERMLRSLNREINPDVREICRRLISDENLFANFEKQADYIFENTNAYEIVDKIWDIISYETDKISGQSNIQEDIHIGQKVLIIQILNPIKAKHLLSSMGKYGYVLSWIKMHENGEKHYKVLFEDENYNNDYTAYFRRDEFKVIKNK